MLSATVIESVDGLDGVRADWDRLAAASNRPFVAPAWALAWWEHLRPPEAELRVVVVSDEDGALVGIGPFYAGRRSWALLAAGFSAAVAPLSEPGRETEVAREIAVALLASSPRRSAIELQQQASNPDWTSLLADALSEGRRSAWRLLVSTAPAPRIDLGDSGFDDWFAAKSSSFRRETRRKQRRLDDLGAEFRYATPETLEADIAHFLRLHRGRREGMGGSSLDGNGIEDVLNAAARELLPVGRMSLLCLDVDGETVAVQLFAAAGDELSAWNSGFDEQYAKASPSVQCILRGLTDLAERGGRTMSLGPGGQDYKYRLADDREEISNQIVVARGPGYLRTRGRLQGRHAGKALKRYASSLLSRD